MSEPILLKWPGGEHRFMLRLGEIRGLESRCDAGVAELYHKLGRDLYRADDLIQVLRWGLVGGEGMDAANAGELVTRIIDRSPLADFKIPAVVVLAHSLFGDQIKEPVDDEGNAPEKAIAAESAS